MFAYGGEDGKREREVDGELNLSKLCTSSSSRRKSGRTFGVRPPVEVANTMRQSSSCHIRRDRRAMGELSHPSPSSGTSGIQVMGEQGRNVYDKYTQRSQTITIQAEFVCFLYHEVVKR